MPDNLSIQKRTIILIVIPFVCGNKKSPEIIEGPQFHNPMLGKLELTSTTAVPIAATAGVILPTAYPS